jgi:transcription termination factor Rho
MELQLDKLLTNVFSCDRFNFFSTRREFAVRRKTLQRMWIMRKYLSDMNLLKR